MKAKHASDYCEDAFEDFDETDENPDSHTNFRRRTEKRTKREKRKTKKKTGSPPDLSIDGNKLSYEELNGDDSDKPHDNKATAGLPVVEGFDPRKNNKAVAEEIEGEMMVCSECAMVGHFAAVDDRVKKVIKNEYDKTRSAKCQGRCVVCFKEGNDLQIVTPDVEAAMKSIAYSYTFYDKFSRDSKAPNLDSLKLQLPSIEEGKPINASNKKSRKKPVFPIKNDFPSLDQEFPREQQNETTKMSTSQQQPPQQKKPITFLPPREVDPFYEKFYVTRGMRGSLKKDRRVRPLGKLPSEIFDYCEYIFR